MIEDLGASSEHVAVCEKIEDTDASAYAEIDIAFVTTDFDTASYPDLETTSDTYADIDAAPTARRPEEMAVELKSAVLSCTCSFVLQKPSASLQALYNFASNKMQKHGITTVESLNRMTAECAKQLLLPQRLIQELACYVAWIPEASVETDTIACTYYETLQTMVSQQESMVSDIVQHLSEALGILFQHFQCDGKAIKFGSREYLYALPHSDLDLVFELPQASITREEALGHVFRWLETLPNVVALKDAISSKYTIEFKFSNQRVDLTACQGSALERHDPSKGTRFVRTSMEALHPIAKQSALLLVDSAKRYDMCRRSNDDPVGEKLKGIHWLLLFLAWNKTADLEFSSSVTMILAFLSFYIAFPFEYFRVDPRPDTPEPFRRRDGDAVVYLLDPISGNRNLAGHLTPKSVEQIRAGMAALQLMLYQQPQIYFREAQERWQQWCAGSVSSPYANATTTSDTLGDRSSKHNVKSFMKAVRENDIITLRKYAESQPALLKHRDGSGRGALFIAAGAGHEEIVRYLLELAADVNERDNHGTTAYQEAHRWFTKYNSLARHHTCLLLMEYGGQ